MTVRNVIGLFPRQPNVEIATSKAILMTVEMDDKRNAGKYLYDEILNTKVDAI